LLVKQLAVERVATLLSSQGLRLRFGPFNVRITSNYPELIDSIYPLYANFELAENEIAEFHVQIRMTRSFLQPFTRRVVFLADGHTPFASVPAEQAQALLEQGIKWAIAVRANHLLLLRTAVVAKNDSVLLLPYSGLDNRADALCAALVHCGYRLFSDAIGVLEPETGQFLPLPMLLTLSSQAAANAASHLSAAGPTRAISLAEVDDITYVAPPADSIGRYRETAPASHLIVAEYVADAPSNIVPLAKSEAFLLLASNSFNYEMLGEMGFRAVTELLEKCSCYRLSYSDYSAALLELNELLDEA